MTKSHAERKRVGIRKSPLLLLRNIIPSYLWNFRPRKPKHIHRQKPAKPYWKETPTTHPGYLHFIDTYINTYLAIIYNTYMWPDRSFIRVATYMCNIISVFLRPFLAVHWRKQRQRAGQDRCQQRSFGCWSDPSRKVGLQTAYVSAWREQTQTCGSLYLALGSHSSPSLFLYVFHSKAKTEKYNLVLKFSASFTKIFFVFYLRT